MLVSLEPILSLASNGAVGNTFNSGLSLGDRQLPIIMNEADEHLQRITAEAVDPRKNVYIIDNLRCISGFSQPNHLHLE